MKEIKLDQEIKKVRRSVRGRERDTDTATAERRSATNGNCDRIELALARIGPIKRCKEQPKPKCARTKSVQ